MSDINSEGHTVKELSQTISIGGMSLHTALTNPSSMGSEFSFSPGKKVI